MRLFLFLFLWIAVSPFAAQAADTNAALFRALDKAGARTQNLLAPIGEKVRFGTLELIVRACVERPPEEEPETSVFVEVWDNLPTGRKTALFSGWMFASSPAVNPLEHRFYDIWPVKCSTSSGFLGAEGESN